MAQIGNKQNAGLNREWAAHVRKRLKRYTAGKRRARDKQLMEGEIKETD
jgi:hypothetical protein